MPAESRAASAKQVVRAHVLPSLAQATEPHGFRILLKGPQARRDLDGSIQRIMLGYDVAPSYAPGALAVLHPMVRVEYTEATPLVERPGLPGSGASVAQSVVFAVPNPVRKQWELTDDRSAIDAGHEIAAVVTAHVIPLLDDITDLDEFRAAYERQDHRISWHDQTVGGVLAGYIVRGRLDEARALANKHFPGRVLAAIFPELDRRLAIGSS